VFFANATEPRIARYGMLKDEKAVRPPVHARHNSGCPILDVIMPLINSPSGYGALTKFFHWLIVILFAFQYVSAVIMLRTPADGAVLGLTQDATYNWHKSVGLIALLVTIARLINRRFGQLPPWAPTVTEVEKRIIHRAEQLLYLAMLVMPLSGLLYVFAGGYGVKLFGVFDLPNPIGTAPSLAALAKWTHVASAMLLLLPLGAHLGIVLGHHFGLNDRLINRMWPARAPRQT
jgi:cytochrome b561